MYDEEFDLIRNELKMNQSEYEGGNKEGELAMANTD